MESLGQFLKRERESRRISQESLANVTRYHISKIEALEKDQYELLPAAPYVKGMLRSIAKYLELDVHEVISRYEEILKIQKEESSGETPKIQKVKIPVLPFYQQKKFLVISATLSFVILVILVSLFFRESKKISTIGEIPLPISETKTETATSVTASEAKGYTVILKSSQAIWVKTQIDSESPQQVNVKNTESLELTGKKVIRFFVSEAKGLELIFNGKRFSHSFEGPHTFFFPNSLETTEAK